MQIRLAVLISLTLAAAPALAQEAPPPGTGLDWTQPVIVDAPPLPAPVIGRPPLPVEIFTREQLESSGAERFAAGLSFGRSDCIRLLNESPGACNLEDYPTPVYKPAEPVAPCNKTDADGGPGACLYPLEK